MAASLALAGPLPPTGEASDVFELTVVATVPILPPLLREFFDERLDGLSAVAGQPCPSAKTGPAPTEAERHFVILDFLDAEQDSPSAREEAAKRFPHDRAAARRLYEKHSGHAGGWLPWTLQEQYGRLVQAFREGDPDRIASEAGVCLHLATDAALPFNTTILGRAPRRSEGVADDPANSVSAVTGDDRRLADRFHGTLVRRLRDRLGFEVRVWPGRAAPLRDPLETAFGVLLDSRRAAEELTALDAAVLAELGASSVDVFAASADVYLARLADQTAPLLEERIEAGALLGAQLIVAAWKEAGSPSLQPTPAGASAPPHVASGSAASGDFVGSIGSTIVHRSNCPHVARISADRRVSYSTLELATAAGRKPCRACRPGSP
ncbi:MAG: hypothetical protein AABZ12_06950 [Planctomycetota bacterium]